MSPDGLAQRLGRLLDEHESGLERGIITALNIEIDGITVGVAEVNG